jgi:hypothetical protein
LFDKIYQREKQVAAEFLLSFDHDEYEQDGSAQVSDGHESSEHATF